MKSDIERLRKLAEDISSGKIKGSIPEYLLNQPKEVELTGDEYEEIFWKFEEKTPVESSSSLHITEDIHVDEDGTKYHFYYPISSETHVKVLIRKEINDNI
jgi:hypothetical protein